MNSLAKPRQTRPFIPVNGLADPVFIELTGPAGSGKSTIAEEIRRFSADRFDFIGQPDIDRRHRLMSHLGAIVKTWRLDPYRNVSRYGRKRLIQGIATVQAAMQWMEGRGPGVYLLDEGPLRVLMDYACHSELQLNVWHRYSVEALKRLEACQILVVRVVADDESRYRRRKHRMSRLEQGDPTFNPQAGNPQAGRLEVRNLDLMFNREWIVEKINKGRSPNLSMVAVTNDVDVTQAAHEILERVTLFQNQCNGRG